MLITLVLLSVLPSRNSRCIRKVLRPLFCYHGNAVPFKERFVEKKWQTTWH
jgi:hypothetical protein